VQKEIFVGAQHQKLYSNVSATFTGLSDSLGLLPDAMKCLKSLSGSKCLQPFQAGHLQQNLPAN